MIKTFTFAVFLSAALLSCKDGDTTKTNTEKTSLPKSSDLYFDFILDGKEMHIDAADISSTYYPNQHNRFAIYAGKENAVTVLITVSQDMTKPSVTPSGSDDNNMNIQQGSVSLQNYPAKNVVTNSYSSTYPETTPVIPDAVIITNSEKDGDAARIITGTFHAKTYLDNSGGVNKTADHTLSGKFRIRHEFSSFNGGKF